MRKAKLGGCQEAAVVAVGFAGLLAILMPQAAEGHVRLTLKGSQAAAKQMLVYTMMRPTGRASLELLARNESFVVTFCERLIETERSIKEKERLKRVFGKNFRVIGAESAMMMRKRAEEAERVGATVSLDPRRIKEFHPDKIGVTSIFHEITHVIGMIDGLSQEQLADQDRNGLAERLGERVSREQQDISEEEARQRLELLLGTFSR